MRLAGLRSWLFWTAAFLMVGATAGCDNPFDPLNKSSAIQGLTYFDFTATQSHWDSDPEWDGIEITMNYYNEFSDSLTFHDKSHKVQIDMYSQKEDPATKKQVRNAFLISKTVDFANSDDLIRIPIEYYSGVIGLPSTESIKGCLQVHVFPPQESPQKELISTVQCDQEFYTPETAQ